MKISKRRILLFVLLVISAVCTYKSIFYGFDSDESYNITLAYRLVKGDRLFREMWELHQTSAIFIAPFIWIFRALSGSMEGIVVFLRAIGCVFQFLTALYFYEVAKKYAGSETALVLGFIIYNYSPKFIQVPEYSFLEYLLFILFFTSVLDYLKRRRSSLLVLQGVILASIVLAYPMVIIGVPFVYISLGIIYKKQDLSVVRNLSIIVLTDVVLGLSYLGYILIGTGFSEFTDNLGYILTDGSHSDSLLSRVVLLGLSCWDNYKQLLMLILVVEILRIIIKKSPHISSFLQKRGEAKKADDFLKIGFIALALMISVFKSVRVFESWGLIYLYSSFFILTLIGAFAYLKVAFGDAGKDMFFWLITFDLGIMFVLAHLGSNLDLHVNAGLLLPLLLVLIIYYKKDTFYKSLMGINDDKSWELVVSLTVLLAVFLILRLCCVRISGSQDVTIFDRLTVAKEGALKYSYIPVKEDELYEKRLSLLVENINGKSEYNYSDTENVDLNVLYMGADKYLYNSTDLGIGIPSTISSPTFDDKLLVYFEKYPYKTPDIILAEEEMINSYPFHETSFGSFVDENYEMSEEEELLVYRRLEGN